MMAALELHHRVPRCMLGFYDRAREGGLDGAGLQAFLDWEEEASRYGVDPDISREELAGLIEASQAPVLTADHRAGHSRAGDFARWGRRGGLRTLALYGRGWFVLLARRRWEGHRRAARRILRGALGQGAVFLMAAPLFPLGRSVATPAALALLAGAGEKPAELPSTWGSWCPPPVASPAASGGASTLPPAAFFEAENFP